MQQYTETDLISSVPGKAAMTDPNLVNAWGVSRSSGSPWWVSDNGTGLSTLYDGTGKAQALVVTIPPSDPSSGKAGTPTGTIFNGTTDFAVAPGKPALFLFATEDGTISGWNPAANATNAIIAVNEKQKSVFKGLTMGQVEAQGQVQNVLYAADFRKGRVAVYGPTFQHISSVESTFAKVPLPAGFAPFNVQNLGGNIYVTYAKQDSEKLEEVVGKGLGFVAVFRTDGRLIQILELGSWLNAPWGVAIASSDFGAYSHDVLVGNLGSGEIVAYDPISGAFKGFLRDSKSNPIVIPGLWGISFGNDASSGNATTLYFAAGPNRGQDGLFGKLTAIQNVAGNDQ